MKITTAFRPDYERYEGERPIIVNGMRLGFAMVFLFVGNIAWKSIISYRGA